MPEDAVEPPDRRAEAYARASKFSLLISLLPLCPPSILSLVIKLLLSRTSVEEVVQCPNLSLNHLWWEGA